MATSKIPVNDKYVGSQFGTTTRTTFSNMNVAGGKTIEITLSNAFRGLMVTTAAIGEDKAKGLYFATSTNSGGVGVQAIHSAGDVTITVDTNKIIISNGTTLLMWINFLIMNGEVTNATVRT